MKAEYLAHMGDDLMVVNAARVSFDKQSVWEDDKIPPGCQECTTESECKIRDRCSLFSSHRLAERDAKLISYLASNGHWSPFSHPQIQFRLTVPFFVANQLKRHQVGFALNEVSRRYVDAQPEFYRPEVWRSRPDGGIKQGSGTDEITSIKMSGHPWLIADVYATLCREALRAYTAMIEANVAPEQARMVLPEGTYTSWIWTGSLFAWARLCKQRLDPHAQAETRLVAQQISKAIKPLFPVSWKALLGNLSLEEEPQL